jgi:hypothetical protein
MACTTSSRNALAEADSDSKTLLPLRFIGAVMLIPFVLTARQNLPLLSIEGHDLGEHPLEYFFVDDADSAPFGKILNYTNQLAFGGDTNMGMPLWVLLDCGILSSAVIGFGVPFEDADDDLKQLLQVPEDYRGLLPVSEYCACPTLEPGCVSGFSLQSQVTGQGIATRTKALAMLLYGASKQVGVTQFDNAAIRVHSRFGPMRITVHRPSLHTHASNSFVYKLSLPDRERLAALARGVFDEVAPETLPEGERWMFDPAKESDHARLRALVTDGRNVWIVPPGWEGVEDGCRLVLTIES